MSSVLQGFTKSLAMTFVSEIGDKTFFAAAILAMRYPRRLVLAGCVSALIVMTILSATVGWAAPNLVFQPSLLADPSQMDASHNNIVVFWFWVMVFMGWGSEELAEVEAELILAMRYPRRLVLAGCVSALIVMTILSATVGWAAPNLFNPRCLQIPRKWTHHITTLLFFGFGLWSLWDGFKQGGGGGSEELAEVEAELDSDLKANGKATKDKVEDENKKQKRPFLTQFFSPIFLKAFSINFFGEFGDKSQLATIGLAADENPFGVILGGVLAQLLCTTAAVIGGKSLASQISERIVNISLL
ncbi:hypothetical protein F2Q69_00054265, partial [Brassica cretica]